MKPWNPAMRVVMVVAVAGLAAGSPTSLRADDEQAAPASLSEKADVASAGWHECSNRTLRGDYGFAIDGSIVTPGGPILVRGVAMTTFDGHGNLTQVDFVTLNGVPASADWRPATGTYEVNADCTGSAEFQPVGGALIRVRMVVTDGGRQVRNVVLGNATGAVGTKVR
jgi:hypothetical protein